MNNADLLKLAASCEQARGPDRELDAAICKALGWKTWERTDGKPWEAQNIERGWFNMPAFTASLDAAMTLVPEGWSVALHAHSENENRACVYYGLAAETFSYAATPALALCAAALRASSERTQETPNP